MKATSPSSRSMVSSSSSWRRGWWLSLSGRPHPIFSRDGSNIKYTYKITLREALCGTVVQVPTLEGKKIGINCTGEVLQPTTVKRLQGYGLPFHKEPERKGDIIVGFDVLF